MRYRTGILPALAAALCATAASAASGAPTFSADVVGNTIVVYSTSEKDIACYVALAAGGSQLFGFRQGRALMVFAIPKEQP